MDDGLTKNARSVLKAAYDTYKKRTKNGISPRNAKNFSFLSDIEGHKLDPRALEDAAVELDHAGFMKLWGVDAQLAEQGIAKMEEMHKQGQNTVLQWLKDGLSFVLPFLK